ncbi:hypothetical protein [Bacillus solimangrovi]|nr:hypothetical protein [Bacillus solimangrovi]
MDLEEGKLDIDFENLFKAPLEQWWDWGIDVDETFISFYLMNLFIRLKRK